MNTRKLISFDWALKRLLRTRPITRSWKAFYPSCSRTTSQSWRSWKVRATGTMPGTRPIAWTSRFAIKKQEIILIEIQYEREFVLSATPPVRHRQGHYRTPDHGGTLRPGRQGDFDQHPLLRSGHGKDYIYHGKTQFLGLHYHDELLLNEKQQELFGKRYPHELYPEYYLLKVKQFDDVAKDSLDEWIYFLKNQEIKGEFQAKGLKKAKEVLDIMNLGEAERRAYEWHMEELSYQASLYKSSPYYEGKEDGAKVKATEIAKALKQEGVSLTVIAKTSGLSPEVIEEL